MMRLRPYKPSDADKLLSWWTEVPEEIFVMWSNGKFVYPLTMEQLEDYFQTWCVDEENGWLMTALDEAGNPVGHFIMRLADYESESIRFGFIIVDPNARGKGYGTAAAKLMIRYCFEELKLHRLFLRVYAENEQAIRSYEKAGFVKEAYLHDDVFVNGRFWDIVLMGIVNNH